MNAMRRYAGEQLAPNPKIAVVTNDALGNFVVATPLLQMLRRELRPSSLDYYGGDRVSEFAENVDFVDVAYPFHGTPPREFARHAVRQKYDLVVNVENGTWAKSATAMLAGEETFVIGPTLDATGRKELPFGEDARARLWEDRNWISADLTKTYPFLKSGFIAEIFCRLCYLEGPVPKYSLPAKKPEKGADVLLSATASLPEKLWPYENWRQVVQSLQGEGLSVGLLGAKPSNQARFWQGTRTEADLCEKDGVADLRGAFSLSEVVGAIAEAQLVLTLDNGILHAACATETPVVGLFRHGIHRLWAPPFGNLQVLEPGEERAVADITAEEVFSRAKSSLWGR
jgi:ADP-heptose:LPS heptosyltransferase